MFPLAQFRATRGPTPCQGQGPSIAISAEVPLERSGSGFSPPPSLGAIAAPLDQADRLAVEEHDRVGALAVEMRLDQVPGDEERAVGAGGAEPERRRLADLRLERLS